MKRKKIYSILALSMAMTLAVGVPVSAATSITTEDFGSDVDVSETKPGEANPDVEQEIVLGVDGAGNVTAVIIPESGDASAVIEEKIASTTTTGIVSSTETVSDAEVLPENVVLTDAEKETYATEAKEKFQAISADKIMVNIPGKQVTVKTVKAEVQSVAQTAAAKMAEKLNLKLTDDSLMASADIHVPLEAGESVKVTIPMAAGSLDTAAYDYFVLHYNEATGAWETLEAQVTEDGIVIATFNSFSPVFVVKAEKAPVPPAQEPSDGDDGNSDGDNGSDSDSGSDSNSSNSGSSGSQKATPAPAANEPVNPAVSPKTGE